MGILEIKRGEEQASKRIKGGGDYKGMKNGAGRGAS